MVLYAMKMACIDIRCQEHLFKSFIEANNLVFLVKQPGEFHS